MDVSIASCFGSDSSHSRAVPVAGSLHSVAPRNVGANDRARHRRDQGRASLVVSLHPLALIPALLQATVQLNNHFYKSAQCVPALFEIASTSPNAAVSSSHHCILPLRRRRTLELRASRVGRKLFHGGRGRAAERDSAATASHLASCVPR